MFEAFIADYWVLVVITGMLVVIRREASRRLNNSGLVTEVTFIYGAYLFYYMVRGLVKDRTVTAFENARSLVEFERSLGFFVEPDLQKMALTSETAINFMNWVYVWLHWPVIVIVLAWLFLHHQQHYPLYRNAMLASGAVALVVFALYPVAPPRFLTSLGFIDTIEQRSYSQHVLLPSGLANKYAALPSLHAGWNLVAAIAIVRHARTWSMKGVGVVLPVLMFSSIVLTGNHYIIDGIAGYGVVAFGFAVAYGLRHITPVQAGRSIAPDFTTLVPSQDRAAEIEVLSTSRRRRRG